MAACKTCPVNLKIEIEPEAMKRVVEQGRLLEFVNVFATVAAEHIKVQLIEEVAKAGVGLIEAGRGVGFTVGADIDEPYLTGPRPWPWPRRFLGAEIRELVRSEIADVAAKM
jgi:hypothetical protein